MSAKIFAEWATTEDHVVVISIINGRLPEAEWAHFVDRVAEIRGPSAVGVKKCGGASTQLIKFNEKPTKELVEEALKKIWYPCDMMFPGHKSRWKWGRLFKDESRFAPAVEIEEASEAEDEGEDAEIDFKKLCDVKDGVILSVGRGDISVQAGLQTLIRAIESLEA